MLPFGFTRPAFSELNLLDTEDYFHRSRSAAELTEFDLQEKDQEASAKRWLDEYVANASKAEGTAIEEEKK